MKKTGETLDDQCFAHYLCFNIVRFGPDRRFMLARCSEREVGQVLQAWMRMIGLPHSEQKRELTGFLLPHCVQKTKSRAGADGGVGCWYCWGAACGPVR